MIERPTLPATHAQFPVRTLRVEVLEGPDAGRIFVATSEKVSIGSADGNDLTLSDATVSRYHAELERRDEGILITDLRSTNGTRVGKVRIERATVPAGTTAKLGNTAIRVVEGDASKVELLEGESLSKLRGRSPAMRRLMARIEKIGSSDAAALLVGESGTGKEVIAEVIHDLSPRRNHPLVTVDCGALSPMLVASELFGHEKGAFTGAERQHQGAFERAHGGTLFLDEIGELPSTLQTTLLGVLERRRFRRVGGQTDIATDVRILSATNRDLRTEVNANAFRLDLYYRLAVVVLDVPPLRERPEDVPALFEHFLREAGHTDPLDAFVSPETMQALMKHHWPGNVRELRNLVEATLALGSAPDLVSVDEPAETRSAGDDKMKRLLDMSYKEARRVLLEEFEVEYLGHLLKKADNNVSKAARLANMDRSYLIQLIQRHDLK